MDQSQKNALIFGLKFAGFFVLFYLFFCTSIVGKLSPCFFGFFLTLAFLGENAFLLSTSYLAANAVFNSSPQSLVFGILCCTIGCAVAQFFKKRQKSFLMWQKCVVCAFVGLAYVLLFTKNLQMLYITTTNVLLNTLFLMSCSNIFKILKVRHFNFNLNVDEVVCACLFVCMLFCGLQNVNVLAFDVVKLAGVAFVLFSNLLLPTSFGVMASMVCAMGTFLCGGSFEYLAMFAMMSLFCFVFKNQKRIYAVVSVAVVDVALNVFLNLFGPVGVISFLPTIIASALFLAVPSQMLKKIKASLFVKKESSTLRNMLNQNKLEMSKKLLYTAEVFFEMDKNFRKLVKGNIDFASAKQMLCTEIVRENCESCPNRSKCLRGFGAETKKIFEDLVNIGFEKGKITLVDLPAYLTNRCTKTSQLLNSINALLKDYRGYAKYTQELDSSKLLVAEQLKGISSVLENLSKQTNEIVCVDDNFEKKIKQSLVYADIIPSEVVCFEKDEKTSVVCMILRAIDFDNQKIEKVLSSVCHSKMILDEITPNQNTGLTYVSYKTAPTYDVVVGIAQQAKNSADVSGDTHSILKLDNSKFMLAICDGMGSGKKANEKSQTSMNIIENFYRAGYDEQTILESVNKLLAIGGENVFSALDLSVIDLKNGEVEFIKQGATIGFVKTGDKVHKIETSGLPLGILNEVTPKLTKTVLTPEDLVIMMSDGVVDALGEEELQKFLCAVEASSPQDLATAILNKAKREQGGLANDDMTVLVGKLFYNVS